MDHSEVAFSAEFVLVHAMLSVQAQEIESLDADLEERVSQADMDNLLQFKEVGRKLTVLSEEVRLLQHNFGQGLSQAALEDQVCERVLGQAAADLKPKLEAIQVDISLERQFVLAALEDQKRIHSIKLTDVKSDSPAPHNKQAGRTASSADTSHIEQAVRVLHDKILSMDIEVSLEKEFVHAAGEVQQRRFNDVKMQIDSLETRTELELQKLELATEEAVRSIQHHVGQPFLSRSIMHRCQCSLPFCCC